MSIVFQMVTKPLSVFRCVHSNVGLFGFARTDHFHRPSLMVQKGTPKIAIQVIAAG
jgi:hypothetical protein